MILVSLLIVFLTAAAIAAVLIVRNLTGGEVVRVDEVTGLKTSYYVGEEVDSEGATMQVVYKDGRKELVKITNDMMEGFDSSLPGKVNVTLHYKESATTIAFTVSPLTVRSLTVDEETRPDVIFSGASFPLGVYVYAELINDTVEHVPVTPDMVKGYRPLAIGNQKITITYKNASVTITAEVREDEIDYASVDTEKTSYAVGEGFSDSVKLVLTYKSGMTRTVKATEQMLKAPFYSDVAGDYVAILRYGGIEATYVYRVE